MRASICVIVDDPEKVKTAEEWLSANSDRLDYISENRGCGCCVDLYDLEGPAEVIATLPSSIQCGSPWTRNES
jgi:hypothetical protein